jgi:hypothetical protein
LPRPNESPGGNRPRPLGSKGSRAGRTTGPQRRARA